MSDSCKVGSELFRLSSKDSLERIISIGGVEYQIGNADRVTLDWISHLKDCRVCRKLHLKDIKD